LVFSFLSLCSLNTILPQNDKIIKRIKMRNENKDYFIKSKQRIKLLIQKPAFQKKIKSLRKKWGISPKGFKSDEESKEWHDKMVEDSDKIIELIDGSAQKGRGNYSIPINDFNNDLAKLVKKFSLPSNFTSTIEFYLKFNKTTAPESITVLTRYNERLGRKELFIQVFDNTTQEDVKKVWPRVMLFKKYLVAHKRGRFREITNLRAEERAYVLQKEKKSLKEIADILKKEGLGTYSYEYVGKLISRFRKRLQGF